jgi:hypothetical protein
MVVGSRQKGELRTSFVNRIGNLGLKLISFIVTWKWLSDTESGFRAFSARKLYSLELISRGYEIEGELLLRALHGRFRIEEVPIHVPFAVPGVTVTDGIKNGLFKLRMGLQLRFTPRE